VTLCVIINPTGHLSRVARRREKWVRGGGEDLATLYCRGEKKETARFSSSLPQNNKKKSEGKKGKKKKAISLFLKGGVQAAEFWGFCRLTKPRQS